jgi:hypothetical protein
VIIQFEARFHGKAIDGGNVRKQAEFEARFIAQVFACAEHMLAWHLHRNLSPEL